MSGDAMTDSRPWMLVAPWYRWKMEGVPATRTARDTWPAIQKYEDANHVNAFLKDPRRSLRFESPEDYVQYLEWLPKLPDLPAPQQGRLRRLSEQRLVTSTTRKLYLDTHKRFYLVTVEAHCDAPGLPDVCTDDICEAGFVVRRRRVLYPIEARKEAAKLYRGLSAAEFRAAEVAWFSDNPPTDPCAVQGVREVASDLADRFEHDKAQDWAKRWQGAADDLARSRERLFGWARDVGARLTVEGWIPGTLDKVGAWAPVPSEPQTLTEQRYPMYPLVPDPADRSHPGNRGTIYFGAVPTGGSEATADGTARFDDHTLYEIECYVRRHDPRCRKTIHPGDCRGPLVWSRPTERYQLAAHFDLTGTSNRPVTIQMPDIPTLRAQAAALRPGQGTPVKMVFPAGSSLEFPQNNEVPKSGTMGPAQICSFAIPLITIVAMFVLSIFLPILMFIFNLWFLLKLKFCLPPTVQLDAGLTTSLSMPGGLDISTAVDVDVSLGAAANAQLQLDLKAGFDKELNVDTTVAPTVGEILTGLQPAPGPHQPPLYSNNVLVRLFADWQASGAAGAAAFSASTVSGPGGEAPPEVEASVDWIPDGDQVEVAIR